MTTAPDDSPDSPLGTPDSARASIRAYLDGELDPAVRARVEAALATDASLRAALARERRLRDTLAAAYAPVLEEPVPEALNALLRPPAAVVALAPARTAPPPRHRAEPRDSSGWWRWGGMAACVVAGVLGGVLGERLWRGEAPSPAPQDMAQAVSPDSGWLLQGAVADALSHQLASEPPRDNGVAVGLSFQAQDRAYCRTFTTRGAAPVGGLACHTPQGWRLQALAPAAPTGSGLRTAGSELPAAVLQAVDGLRQGDTLDAAAEAAARARGWRP